MRVGSGLDGLCSLTQAVDRGKILVYSDERASVYVCPGRCAKGRMAGDARQSLPQEPTWTNVWNAK
jgi:hypothetical protein